jgi:hypothetical protein
MEHLTFCTASSEFVTGSTSHESSGVLVFIHSRFSGQSLLGGYEVPPNPNRNTNTKPIPVISSKNNANSDYVNEELKTRIIINPGDKKELKNAITTIVKNSETFSGNIPEIIKEHSFEGFGEKLESIYKESLEERKNNNEKITYFTILKLKVNKS